MHGQSEIAGRAGEAMISAGILAKNYMLWARVPWLRYIL